MFAFYSLYPIYNNHVRLSLSPMYVYIFLSTYIFSLSFISMTSRFASQALNHCFYISLRAFIYISLSIQLIPIFPPLCITLNQQRFINILITSSIHLHKAFSTKPTHYDFSLSCSFLHPFLHIFPSEPFLLLFSTTTMTHLGAFTPP